MKNIITVFVLGVIFTYSCSSKTQSKDTTTEKVEVEQESTHVEYYEDWDTFTDDYEIIIDDFEVMCYKALNGDMDTLSFTKMFDNVKSIYAAYEKSIELGYLKKNDDPAEKERLTKILKKSERCLAIWEQVWGSTWK